MRTVRLGLNGPEVSEVCFGSLAISPLQGRVSAAEGREVLNYACSKGINWVDTAEIYENYDQLRPVLANNPGLKVVTKSYAITKEELLASLNKARSELDRDFIDVFLLHEQESHLTLRGHNAAWEAMSEAKARGMIGYIGISTHTVQGVKAGALQPGLDIIHPLINYQGLGIVDGGLQDMLEALDFASQLGIGLYAMKVFGGGHLAGEPKKALRFIQNLNSVQAMALGMSSSREVDYNLAVLAGQAVPDELKRAVLQRPRRLYIADWCQGCGACIETCPQGALTLQDGQACLKKDQCILCGYCGRVCPHFCLKIV